MRFPADARIRRGQDFKTCFAARQRLSGRYFLLQWRANGLDHARLGLAVSRKVDRRAVGRNRLKRLLREAFRAVRADLPPIDLVASPKAEATRVTSAMLRADLDVLWGKLRALPALAPQGTMPAASGPAEAVPVTSAADPTT